MGKYAADSLFFITPMSDNVGKGSDVDLTMTSDKQHV
jgi:hypothetical protein